MHTYIFYFFPPSFLLMRQIFKRKGKEKRRLTEGSIQKKVLIRKQTAYRTKHGIFRDPRLLGSTDGDRWTDSIR